MDNNENIVLSTDCFTCVMIVFIMLILTSLYFARRYSVVTDVYCQQEYNTDVVKYNKCKNTDLLNTLTLRKKK